MYRYLWEPSQAKPCWTHRPLHTVSLLSSSKGPFVSPKWHPSCCHNGVVVCAIVALSLLFCVHWTDGCMGTISSFAWHVQEYWNCLKTPLLARNKRIFKNQPSSQHRIVHKTIQAVIKFFYLATPVKPVRNSIPQIIKWIALIDPFTKLNMDGSALANPGKAGAGDLLRDSSSLWISRFSLSMGITTNNMAELGAVQQGLMMAWDLGFKFIQLELDSVIVLS